jgi:hypothetical protein
MKTTKDTTEAPRLEMVRVWRGQHRGVQFQIKNRDGIDGLDQPSGAWTAYIFLHETMLTNFDFWWLPDELSRFTEASPERVSHDYMRLPAEMHGGLTYYAKHGHSVGHRCVELGCDYQHLWDEGQHYSERSVMAETMGSIDKLYADGHMKSTEQPPAATGGQTK